MPKVTQYYKLFKFLEDGSPKTIDEIKDELGIKYYSVEVYICEMKRCFKAEFEREVDGRKTKTYKLTNASKIKSRIPQFRSNNMQYVKPEYVEFAGQESRIDFAEDYQIPEMNEREMIDTIDSLGVNFGDL